MYLMNGIPDPADTELLQLVHPLAKCPPRGLLTCPSKSTLPLICSWYFIFELGKSKHVVELTKVRGVNELFSVQDLPESMSN